MSKKNSSISQNLPQFFTGMISPILYRLFIHAQSNRDLRVRHSIHVMLDQNHSIDFMEMAQQTFGSVMVLHPAWHGQSLLPMAEFPMPGNEILLISDQLVPLHMIDAMVPNDFVQPCTEKGVGTVSAGAIPYLQKDFLRDILSDGFIPGEAAGQPARIAQMTIV